MEEEDPETWFKNKFVEIYQKERTNTIVDSVFDAGQRVFCPSLENAKAFIDKQPNPDNYGFKKLGPNK